MNFGDTLKQFVGTIAPLLGTALGGPLGGYAGSLIGKALGVNDPNNQKAMTAAMASATPDQLLALKKADQEFAAKMKELEVDEEKLAYDDRANARAREIATKDSTPKILAFAVCALVVLAEGGMMLLGQPKGVDGVVLGRVLGTLDSALMLILSYYFGSSIGSKAKDDALADIAKQS